MISLLAKARTSKSIAFSLGLLVAASASAHEPLPTRIDEVTKQLRGNHDPQLLLERADLHRLAGHWDLATRDCEAVLQIAPELDGVHLCLSRVALGRGDPASAAREARIFLARTPTAAGYRALSLALASSGDMGEAAAARKQAIEIADPQDPADFLELARLLSSLGDAGTDPALLALEKGMERLGPLLALQATAVEIGKNAGRFEDALNRIDFILEAVDRTETWQAERGRILLAAGRVPEAWVAFSDALAAIERLPAHQRNTEVIRQLEAELLSRLRHSEEGSVP
jgi:tetratricopeptide (TPR) repeat protein